MSTKFTDGKTDRLILITFAKAKEEELEPTNGEFKSLYQWLPCKHYIK